MLVKIETASPPFQVPQKVAAEELKKRMKGSAAVGRLIDMAANQSGIDGRYFVVSDGDQNSEKKFFTKGDEYLSPDTETRMNEYKKWSVKLTEEAVEKLFASTKIKPDEIDRIITISCTGFFAPGIDYKLIEKFNLPRKIKRTNIGFMGCAASLIGFSNSLDALNSGSENILLISVELCSLHLQTEPTRDNILANMIFADGSAAALITKENVKSSNALNIIFTESVLFDNSAELMGWEIGNNGFEMILSSELPKIISNSAAGKVKQILSDNGTGVSDIKHWALHPGGRAILDALQNGLNLNEKQMKPSREVLREYGNLSSVSILFVLKKILNSKELKKDDLCCAIAFGPGLTMEIVLFKVN